jgi:DNA damage-binding protein 1
MKSLSVITYRPGKDGKRGGLIEIARHYQISWATAVAPLDKNVYLECDDQCNILVMEQNLSGVTAEDKHRLEVTSELNLGEMVNRIRTVNVPTSADLAVTPKAFLATVCSATPVYATRFY